MLKNKNFLLFIPAILFLTVNLFIATNKIYAQDIPNGQDNDDVILDSIDVKENLLDSNTVYQRDFDSLSNQGEWVKINRADLIKDVNGDDATIVEDDDPTVVKIIYIWRPRNIEQDWTPYSNGRWVFTWRGWIWESDYDWGWACYNYGRWYWSSYYGWCWLPGRVWAPNWCMWRTHGNYCGWYPTCPRIHWRHHGHWVRNHVFKSKTKNWVFVEKKDFTKKIDKTKIVKNENNADILKNSEKIKGVNTYTTEKKQIKYNGPEVNNISKETGEKILPQKVKITRTINNGTGPKIDNTRITKNGNGNYNPTWEKHKTTRDGTTPREETGRTHTTRSPDGTRGNGNHNNGPKSTPPTKNNGSNNNGPKSSPPTKNNGSNNNGSKSDGDKKK